MGPPPGRRVLLPAVAACAAISCTGPTLDFFAAPEPGWEPRPLQRVAVVVRGESEEGRRRLISALAKAGPRHGMRLIAVAELVADLPDSAISGRPDSGRLAERDAVAALIRRAVREEDIQALLEIRLDAGGRVPEPGMEHTVRECDRWIERAGRLMCLRPREVTFRGDTLYRPWASYDIRLRDPESGEILWRGGAHTTSRLHDRPAALHRDLVELLIREMAEDGILPQTKTEGP